MIHNRANKRGSNKLEAIYLFSHEENMKAMGIKEEMVQGRCAWRNITGGPTRASADA